MNPKHPSSVAPFVQGAESVLKGTTPLQAQGDFAPQMVDSIHRYLLNETTKLAQDRAHFWNRDFTSPELYERSLKPNRERLSQIIGAVDARIAFDNLDVENRFAASPVIARGSGFSVYRVRWPVLGAVTADSEGLIAEGLLLQPEEAPVARVIAIPDADWSPEMIVGIAHDVPTESQFGRRLAEHGLQVIVPLLINREDTFSGVPGVGMSNMPHREWIYRMAFEAGRHIIGFEVQKVLAAVDWFDKENRNERIPIGVMGYGEGGLVALYSAALDTRISATVVSGYFQPREDLWREPIYRDVWGLLREFGDAEIASMIAPRRLIVEACQAPQVSGPPPPTQEHKDLACPNGKLTTPPLEAVEGEVARARAVFEKLGKADALQLVTSDHGAGLPGSDATMRAFLRSLGCKDSPISDGVIAAIETDTFDPEARLNRQFNQIVDFTQALIRKSPQVRIEFWKHADSSCIKSWGESTKFYRSYVWDEVIGRLPAPSLAPNSRTRLVLNEPGFKGFEVLLDVWPEVFAYGILLVPNNIKPGERRPVVVCQHGLEGRPIEIVAPKMDHHFYHHFGADLAEEGFVVFAPQNPYIGDDHFRIIQRMGHPIKLALFSFILGQHQQILRWLCDQPFVDPERIGFYGLSYGGKTAVRVPPLLDRYALSICSGDFNEWVWKTTSVLAPQSYMLTKEYDMYEFNFANIVNYADLANLLMPKPFMVERGHNDPVSVDEWVAYEYALVREFYDKMGVGENTRIEFFSGPHTIHAEGTFQFLRRHLDFPEPKSPRT